MSKLGLLVCALGIALLAQSPKTPMFDARLSIHTIVREDIFAGFMANDNQRFLQGEKNTEILLAERAADKAPLTAWKASIALKRAVDANEAKRPADFEREYRKALDLFAEAARLGPADGGVMAITGGVYALFSDRLPEAYRRTGWDTAYKAYTALWQGQGPAIDQMPVHLKGELLAGMAQSAQRTGNDAVSAQFVEKIIAKLPGTPYAAVAKKWTESPAIASKTNLTCHTCHEPGRLAARKASLGQ